MPLDPFVSTAFYNREGQRIAPSQAEALLRDPTYTRVEQTTVGHCVVSTIWLGVGFLNLEDPAQPYLFETLVYELAQPGEIPSRTPDMRNVYAKATTEALAREAHARCVAIVRTRLGLEG